MARLPSEAARIIGSKILKLRTELGITQRDLEALSTIEVSNIGKYERGQSLPSLSSLVRLATSLGVDPGELVSGLTPEDFPGLRHTATVQEFMEFRNRNSQY